MVLIQPTVLDVSRAVAELDEYSGHDKTSLTVLRRRVANGLAWNWDRHDYMGRGYNRTKVTKRDVAAAMSAHGATVFTLNIHAGIIAGMIRADFTNGGNAS